MAIRSISSNKMRAALTMLGIIIGVMALVVLVSLVNGATSSVTVKGEKATRIVVTSQGFSGMFGGMGGAFGGMGGFPNFGNSGEE